MNKLHYSRGFITLVSSPLYVNKNLFPDTVDFWIHDQTYLFDITV